MPPISIYINWLQYLESKWSYITFSVFNMNTKERINRCNILVDYSSKRVLKSKNQSFPTVSSWCYRRADVRACDELVWPLEHRWALPCVRLAGTVSVPSLRLERNSVVKWGNSWKNSFTFFRGLSKRIWKLWCDQRCHKKQFWEITF